MEFIGYAFLFLQASFTLAFLLWVYRDGSAIKEMRLELNVVKAERLNDLKRLNEMDTLVKSMLNTVASQKLREEALCEKIKGLCDKQSELEKKDKTVNVNFEVVRPLKVNRPVGRPRKQK